MKRIMPLIMLALFLQPLTTKADIVWSGIQEQILTPLDFSLDFDINDDGVFDFLFRVGSGIDFYFDPFDGNAGLGKVGYIIVKYDPVIDGVLIGPDMDSSYAWENGERTLLSYIGAEGGGWHGGGTFYDTNAFLGVKFQVDDATHYGWIHLMHDHESSSNFNLTIQDWAWESEPDTAILAGAIPEPSTGILTMVGSLSLLYVARARRRKQAKLPSIPKYRPTAVNDPATF